MFLWLRFLYIFAVFKKTTSRSIRNLGRAFDHPAAWLNSKKH
jgi:hypothetical protein